MTHGMKTKKALLKRIKVTGRGKILKRRSHQSHFNAKESGNVTRSKRGDMAVPKGNIQSMRALIS